MIGSALFAMVDYFPGDPVIPSADMLLRPAINLTIAVIASAIVIALLARYFPSLPLFRKLILSTAPSVGPAFAATTDVTQTPVQVGLTGIARSILRPAGKAEIDGALVDVVTDGEFLDAGTAVRVTHVEGSRVVVGPVS
jgi:membrane-bound serine protease (ClpP class)